MVVVFGQKKGGVWKSMTALGVAGVAASRGLSVIVLDADSNRSCDKFLQRRTATNDERIANGLPELPYIKRETKTPDENIARELQELDKLYDLVIVDTGGYENNAFKTAVRTADIVYLPTHPCQVDLDELVPTVNVLNETEVFIRNMTDDQEYSIDARLLITGVHSNSKEMLVEAMEIVKSLLKWCSLSSAVISHVKKVKQIQADGLTLADLDKPKHKDRAMYEILFDEIMGKRQVRAERVG
ncbi:ParA family protein [Shewanella marisflavi]|uniref:ParA family protein n=1 Tax=Shewanella marisflavi TaxID=260364 RepID=UPI003AAEFF74